jgi:predicted esterase
VIFYLHGGIAAPAPKRRDRWWRGEERVYRQDTISVFPASWNRSPWWQFSQAENLSAILERLKRDYNIDENRVYIFGVSDGAAGGYYQVAVNSTPWAGVLNFIGHMGVLANPSNCAQGRMAIVNMTNTPFLVFNGGRDPLYPAARVEHYIRLLRRAGGNVAWHPKPGAGHDLRWLREETQTIDTFIDNCRRKPYPDRLVWETSDLKRMGRLFWLKIERLGTAAGEPRLPEWNVIYMGQYKEKSFPVFPRKAGEAWGRVELEKKGNRVTARTRGVKAFTLLLSPGHFNFQEPVEVVVNGKSVFSGHVKKSVAALLKWAAVDLDRTMLFAAELTITL